MESSPIKEGDYYNEVYLDEGRGDGRGSYFGGGELPCQY
jgi:hypothetical protein